MTVRSCLSEAGDGAGDQSGIERGERGMVDTQSLVHSDGEVGQYDIGFGGECVKCCETLGLLEIEDLSLLVAAVCVEVVTVTVATVSWVDRQPISPI